MYRPTTSFVRRYATEIRRAGLIRQGLVNGRHLPNIIAGLDPAIRPHAKKMDPWVKPAGDGRLSGYAIFAASRRLSINAVRIKNALARTGSSARRRISSR